MSLLKPFAVFVDLQRSITGDDDEEKHDGCADPDCMTVVAYVDSTPDAGSISATGASADEPSQDGTLPAS